MRDDPRMIQRTFIIGDEWLYYKIYTGYKTSDLIIREVISPLVEYLLKEQLIDKWFFIRYNDPKYHLRIRLHLSDVQKISRTVLKLNALIRQFVAEDLIWKVQTDTYQREIEKYGAYTMELSENIFFIDSMATIELITKLFQNESENTRWLLSLKTVDVFLDDFGYNLIQKNDLLKIIIEKLENENNLSLNSHKLIATKYRKYKNEINMIMNENLLNEYQYVLIQKSEKLKPIIKRIKSIKVDYNLQNNLSNLVSIYIHMMLNRIFRTNHLKHELVIYKFLHYYYKSQLARLTY